jgi:4-amino-4-deoxy-L-arabinose transferase-like glycosyltransferase
VVVRSSSIVPAIRSRQRCQRDGHGFGVSHGSSAGAARGFLAIGGAKKAAWLPTGICIALITYLAINAYALIDLQSFLAANEHTLRIRTVDSGAEYGDRWSRYGSAWLYVVRYALGYGIGTLFTAWMLVGAGWAAARRRPTELLLLSWLVPYFVLISISPAKFMRYSAPLIPGLAILAAGCTCAVFANSRINVRVGAAALAVIAVVYTVVYDGAYMSLFSSLDPRSVAAGWLTQHAPAAARLHLKSDRTAW